MGTFSHQVTPAGEMFINVEFTIFFSFSAFNHTNILIANLHITQFVYVTQTETRQDILMFV